MSKYIGKRVSYPCDNCNKQITLSKKTVDAGERGVFCDIECLFNWHDDLIQQREAEAIRRLHRLLHKRIKRSNSIKTDNTGNYKLDTRAKRISYKNGFNVSIGMTHKLLDRLTERGQNEVQG